MRWLFSMALFCILPRVALLTGVRRNNPQGLSILPLGSFRMFPAMCRPRRGSPSYYRYKLPRIPMGSFRRFCGTSLHSCSARDNPNILPRMPMGSFRRIDGADVISSTRSCFQAIITWGRPRGAGGHCILILDAKSSGVVQYSGTFFRNSRRSR